VRFADNELRDYSQAFGLGDLFQQPMLRLIHQFEEAKNFGSLIQPCLDEQAIANARRAIETKDVEGQLFLRETHLKVLRVLEQAEALTQRYHVVVANPPYMGGGAMNSALKTFVSESFPAGKADLYGAFILRNLRLVTANGFVGMITIPNWLFLDGFTTFRSVVLDTSYLSSLVHNGRGVWGGDFGSCAFTIVKAAHKARHGVYKRLFKTPGEIQANEEIEGNFHNTVNFPNYLACSSDFEVVPGRIIAYWAAPQLLRAFQNNPPLGGRLDTAQGMKTLDNERFIRSWWEVSWEKSSMAAIVSSGDPKWFPVNHGGEFRKWYGNNESVINWENDGKEIKALAKSKYNSITRTVTGMGSYFKPGVTWTAISSCRFGSRKFDSGYLFTNAGMCAFGTESKINLACSFLNSLIAATYLEFIAPTVNFGPNQVKLLPLPDDSQLEKVAGDLAERMVSRARADWDNFETSWDFRDQPLLRPGLKGATLEASWRNWEAHCTAAIRRMQELETENNRLFIAAYGLDGELQPEVPEDQITLARAEGRRDMAAFLSYAVGCLFGRYSLDKPGLILANQGDTLADYLSQVPEPRFMPDADNVIPLLDGDWFPDDVTERCRRFLRVTFGEEHYADNLAFIEAALGKDLRKYFIRDFYADHVKRYKKRPIYWLFTSPKGTFNALIYLHRYRPDTVSVVLQYLRDFRQKLAARLDQLQHLVVGTAASQGEKTRANKAIDVIKKQLLELEDYERDTLYPLATEQIALDLDDGVKVNYLKLGPALKKIVGLEAKGED
jgi:hypothetical protein